MSHLLLLFGLLFVLLNFPTHRWKGPLPLWHCRLGACFLTKVHCGLRNVEQNNHKKKETPLCANGIIGNLKIFWPREGPPQAVPLQRGSGELHAWGARCIRALGARGLPRVVPCSPSLLPVQGADPAASHVALLCTALLCKAHSLALSGWESIWLRENK